MTDGSQLEFELIAHYDSLVARAKENWGLRALTLKNLCR
jgi:hypothetical protein